MEITKRIYLKPLKSVPGRSTISQIFFDVKLYVILSITIFYNKNVF